MQTTMKNIIEQSQNLHRKSEQLKKKTSKAKKENKKQNKTKQNILNKIKQPSIAIIRGNTALTTWSLQPSLKCIVFLAATSAMYTSLQYLYVADDVPALILQHVTHKPNMMSLYTEGNVHHVNELTCSIYAANKVSSACISVEQLLEAL